MATTSFKKEFLVDNPKAIQALLDSVENPVKIKVSTRNLEDENKKGLLLLKQHLSSLAR
ncbi:hypothetical protein [Testudinibacter aquarius]|uniref:Uncharacterized protein n=1 Tax=Testudinibacter aquarius TaxID=1524974 RepID=A0A4R3XYL0_9PAST|nr:hypothetical protein [Testudinibacter aquarius]TCV84182.1 hypothetical protein EDC16_11211 [Testudinibacter aquarius]